MNRNDKQIQEKLVELAFSNASPGVEEAQQLRQQDEEGLYEIAHLLQTRRTVLTALEQPVSASEVEQIQKRMANLEAATGTKQTSNRKKTGQWYRFRIPILAFSSALMVVFAFFIWPTKQKTERQIATGQPVLKNSHFPLFIQSSMAKARAIPSQTNTVLAFHHDKQNYANPIVKYRHSLTQNHGYTQQEIQKITATLKQLGQQQPTLTNQNQQAIYHFLLADNEICHYVQQGVWQDRVSAEQHLQQAQSLFQQVLQQQNNSEHIYNYLAARIASIFFKKSFPKQTVAEILGYLLEDTQPVVSFLFEKNPQMPKNISWKAGMQTDKSIFLISYLTVLNLAYFEEIALRDLPEELINEERQRILQLFTLLEQDTPGKKSYWHHEFLAMKQKLSASIR